jgi:hypothetical protein
MRERCGIGWMGWVEWLDEVPFPSVDGMETAW